MEFILNKDSVLTIENEALPGIKRIGGYVTEDLKKVFGSFSSLSNDVSSLKAGDVFAGTIGFSPRVDELITSSKIDVGRIRGKREVYMYTVLDGVLHIIGSDKRGTVYGLFRLSSLAGVSPFVNWGDVYPLRKESVVLTDSDMITSKEPSVKYRGFFINDEWPAFGNWCNKRFGGFNAKCYERVFELLLRLKGNYLWPAMWSARFHMDGPELLNASLADEMGVVMGMSHHEPCSRNGEEYKYVRGKDSIYGDDWNFARNKEGITRFWEDGLKRNAPFENVFTVGMRGEADSTILGHEATLKDNIEYLRDVLKTQERLFRENVNEDVMKVPRMLALYKEVEPFFYGDENTPGLMDSEDLEGVTLMLCDDNFGNLRTIPTEHMKKHNGGYGMYYHFDYHGSPISYEWVNSSYLPKVHQQMCTAYDNGIRELWIVNVGDIFTTEFPLAYFLELAYDYDKWGSSNKDSASEFTRKFIKEQFPSFSAVEEESTYELLDRYTYLAHNRRPETLSVKRLLENKREEDLDELYKECVKLMHNCKLLYDGMSTLNKFPFYELVYYPAMGNLNTHLMWLENAYAVNLASMGAVMANELNAQVLERIKFDHELIEELHTIHDGFWYGMGMSEHIGFENWNEEECKYPVLPQVIPSNKARVVASIPGSLISTEGGDWTKKTLVTYTDKEGVVILFATSYKETLFSVSNISPYINVCADRGVITDGGSFALSFTVDEESLKKEGKGEFTIDFEYGHIKVSVYPESLNPRIEEALLPEGGKVVVKAPYDGKYFLDVFMAPTNPPFVDNKLLFDLQVNNDVPETYNAVSDTFKVGDNGFEWYEGVLNNVRIKRCIAELKKGDNTVVLTPKSIGMVFKKIIARFDAKL